ncbi:MAG: hypothetical protein CM15mP68_4480 [Pseudomonadota bacterium]|nr:MAG: hypothetical protein CM15mP68_4480 [Pseudomonadota bacterium]
MHWCRSLCLTKWIHAPAKARELAALARDGEYAKGEEEDLDSMIQGLVGYKGQVHVHFSPPLPRIVIR